MVNTCTIYKHWKCLMRKALYAQLIKEWFNLHTECKNHNQANKKTISILTCIGEHFVFNNDLVCVQSFIKHFIGSILVGQIKQHLENKWNDRFHILTKYTNRPFIIVIKIGLLIWWSCTLHNKVQWTMSIECLQSR